MMRDRWFSRLFGRKAADPSEALYAAIVAAARQEKFYRDWAVADTLEGRFEVLVVHMFLVLDRLKAFGKTSENLRQALTDRFFADMDAVLREVGVGDLTVGKKVRKMAEAYFGRVSAYQKGLAADDGALTDAVARNIYAEADAAQASRLAGWMRGAQAQLLTQDYEALAQGKVRFGT